MDFLVNKVFEGGVLVLVIVWKLLVDIFWWDKEIFSVKICRMDVSSLESKG